ncbi:SURF1 family protein [Psychromicrobium lacuslunae]|uniref:SURF1-like protein n=1 Tax=Psychromicrobium lacuslunae TaxID=1618207 RepID=A0A0D4BZR9_9MICC|nr:SURF1 family protein [Psychromicrobium lacuslunae]AJT41635.1 membrane protein [Psychromicrobium lacuslunae]
MLKTALKPRWIAALLLALIVSTVFVLLSQWQFSRSTQNSEPVEVATEELKPLESILKPGKQMTSDQSDHLVSMSGHFDPSKQVLVKNRLQNGTNGYWVVTAFVVDGAPKLKGVAGSPTIIPVARGWLADPGQLSAPPSGALKLTGRLLPPEAPTLEKGLPSGQVAALATAELINIWQVNSYSGFVVSFTETGAQGDVGAHAVAGDLKGISVGPQPVEQPVNWLNIFYAVEWVVFAGFAIFMWWRLVADDYRRENEPEFDEQGDEEYNEESAESADDSEEVKQ